MPDPEKTAAAICDPRADYSHRFADVVGYLLATGWKVRVKGSHFIFSRPGVRYILNLQKEKDGKCKGYQIRQVRAVLAAEGLLQNKGK